MGRLNASSHAWGQVSWRRIWGGLVKGHDCLVSPAQRLPLARVRHARRASDSTLGEVVLAPAAWRGGGSVWNSVEHPALHCGCSMFPQGGW